MLRQARQMCFDRAQHPHERTDGDTTRVTTSRSIGGELELLHDPGDTFDLGFEESAELL